ncbi:MAG: flagellar basal body-associated FliL family protein [Alphaproteobacteria bacterium]|nr:flagellar basal body-associated FliL family protein [Alphaproteobacteria bacterium]
MKKIVIALGALLLLGGGGAGAYFYFFAPAQASVPEGEEGGDEHVAKEESHGGGGHGEGASFVELDPLILPIIDNSGVTQVVSLVVAIEVGDASAADKVKTLSPRLKDAYIQDMYGVLNERAALKGGVIQVSAIKKRLNSITQKVLGEDVAQDVLLQVVQQRPI